MRGARTVDGGRGNASTTARRTGYSVRYAGDDVRYDRGSGVSSQPATVAIWGDDVEDGAQLAEERHPLVVG